jgi:hypothetical protein
MTNCRRRRAIGADTISVGLELTLNGSNPREGLRDPEVANAAFACIAGNCCAACDTADFNADADSATDADIEAFFRVLAGGSC